MRKLDALLSAYGESHQNPINKRIHWVCVPLIVLSLMGLLASASPWLLGAVIIGALVYYWRLSMGLAAGMALFIALGLLLISMIDALFTVSLVVFVLAWIGQFIGHKIEGKKPSFMEDLQFLLIGPAWVIQALRQP